MERSGHRHAIGHAPLHDEQVRGAKLKITVLMGGESAERNVSLASGIRIILALRSRGHEVIAFDPSQGEDQHSGGGETCIERCRNRAAFTRCTGEKHWRRVSARTRSIA